MIFVLDVSNNPVIVVVESVTAVISFFIETSKASKTMTSLSAISLRIQVSDAVIAFVIVVVYLVSLSQIIFFSESPPDVTPNFSQSVFV